MSEERQGTISDIVAEMRSDCPEMHWDGTMYRDDDWVYTKETVEKLTGRIEAAAKREIETLRALVEGLLKASSIDCASCGYDCGPRRENCITKQAIAYLEGHS